jgi:hypothetical protein
MFSAGANKASVQSIELRILITKRQIGVFSLLSLYSNSHLLSKLSNSHLLSKLSNSHLLFKLLRNCILNIVICLAGSLCFSLTVATQQFTWYLQHALPKMRALPTVGYAI